VVAGAHGKTTTSSMIASLLNQAQLEPTIAVGGIINTTGMSANLGKGKYFVAEVDESDGSFLYFRPKIAVITNIDFEHIDFYKNWQGIEDAYAKFIENCADDGCIMAYGDDPRLRNLLARTNKTRLTYGLTDACDIVAKNIVHHGYESTAQVYVRGQLWGVLRLSVPGIHNVLNSLAVVACGLR
jgi:UDP-N-acetylmuramate--alanine ligase